MKITLQGEPISKARHRYVRQGNHLRSYDPQHYQKMQVKQLLCAEIQKIVNDGNQEMSVDVLNLTKDSAYEVDLNFYVPVPKSLSTVKRNAYLWGFEIPSKTDLDNLVKFVLDAANEILWADDRTIMKLTAKKKYSENPRTEINVMKIMDFEEDLERQHQKNILCIFSPSELDDFTKQVRFLFNSLTLEDSASVVSQICLISDKYVDKLSKAKKIYSIYRKKELNLTKEEL